MAALAELAVLAELAWTDSRPAFDAPEIHPCRGKTLEEITCFYQLWLSAGTIFLNVVELLARSDVFSIST